jgi:hypothetical protein
LLDLTAGQHAKVLNCTGDTNTFASEAPVCVSLIAGASTPATRGIYVPSGDTLDTSHYFGGDVSFSNAGTLFLAYPFTVGDLSPLDKLGFHIGSGSGFNLFAWTTYIAY